MVAWEMVVRLFLMAMGELCLRDVESGMRPDHIRVRSVDSARSYIEDLLFGTEWALRSEQVGDLLMLDMMDCTMD